MSREEARIVVRVQPNAGRSEVLGFKNGCLRIKIAASPIKGKANRELLSLLSDVLKISKCNIAIKKGTTSKTKVIGISGLSQEQLMGFDWKK